MTCKWFNKYFTFIIIGLALLSSFSLSTNLISATGTVLYDDPSISLTTIPDGGNIYNINTSFTNITNIYVSINQTNNYTNNESLWEETTNIAGDTTLHPKNLSQNVGVGTNNSAYDLEVRNLDGDDTIFGISSGTGNSNATLMFREADVVRYKIFYDGLNGIFQIYSFLIDKTVLSFDLNGDAEFSQNVNIDKNLSVAGNISGSYLFGDGSLIVNITKMFIMGSMGNINGAIINSVDNHTANSNNIIFAILGNGTSGTMMPHFWIQNGAGSQASGVSRSFMIVNEAVTQQNTTNITSCIEYSRYANFSLYIDCNTTTTGADLLVGDDMQVVGDTFTNNTNISGLLTTQNIHVEGNVSIKRPYAMFSSTELQTISLANTAYTITFNWTEDNYLVYKENDQNFSVSQSGDYKIDLSAIFSPDSPNQHAEIWVQKTNSSGQFVNIPRSNTRITMPSAATEMVVAVPFILDLYPTEKFRIMMASDDAGTQLVYIQNTSYSPMTPSIIMTIHKISEIPTV